MPRSHETLCEVISGTVKRHEAIIGTVAPGYQSFPLISTSRVRRSNSHDKIAGNSDTPTFS